MDIANRKEPQQPGVRKCTYFFADAVVASLSEAQS
jgi:hypothetical protein